MNLPGSLGAPSSPLVTPPCSLYTALYLYRHVVVPVDVVRDGEGDPIVAVAPLEGQQPVARVDVPLQVAHLDLRGDEGGDEGGGGE